MLFYNQSSQIINVICHTYDELSESKKRVFSIIALVIYHSLTDYIKQINIINKKYFIKQINNTIPCFKVRYFFFIDFKTIHS